MESILPLIFDNLDIVLSVCFMAFPFLAVLWESYTFGANIQQQRAVESTTFQQLVTQVQEATQRINQLQAETVAKNLLDKNQLQAIVTSNVNLNKEIVFLRKTVEEESFAIKELGKFMYEKNRVTDGLVMIVNDHKDALKLLNGDFLTLGGDYESLLQDLKGAKQNITNMGDFVNRVRDTVNANAAAAKKQFNEVNIKLAQQQKSTDDFKAWVEGELKMLIDNLPSGGNASNQDIDALKVDLKKLKDLFVVLRDNVVKKDDTENQFEADLKNQSETLDNTLADYAAFKDDYYQSVRNMGNNLDKVMADLYESYVPREEVQEAFMAIKEDIIASQCNCNPAISQQLQLQQEPATLQVQETET